MNSLILSLIFAFNMSSVAPVKEVKIDKTHLYQHWVVSAKESKESLIVYRPIHMAEEKKISMHYKYSGMTIKKGGKLRRHRWRMCGNDTGPTGYNHKWTWKSQKDGTALLIIKKRQTYKVLKLTKNILKVQIVDEKG